MLALLRLVFVVLCVLCLAAAAFSNGVIIEDVQSSSHAAEEPAAEPCVLELTCFECVPEHMPAVTSHRAGEDGAVRVRAGHEVGLSCGAGHFLAYPLHAELRARCEAGRYRVRHDGALRHLLELGCQEDLFEDVLHSVEHCAPPLQGRAYVTRSGGRVRHVATVCYDADRALAVWLRAGGDLTLPVHSDAAAPLSLLGNFNHMFDASTRRDAERLYSDDASLARRLRELLKHEDVSLAGQALTAGRLLAPRYFPAGAERAAEFASNKVAVWGSVADGNLRHLQADVARALRTRSGLQVIAGTHGAAALPAGGALLLRGSRFPVPRYVWTALVAADGTRGVALVLLNDPFVPVSDIRSAVFCDSTCGALPWLRDVTRQRRFERALLGLVFCCSLPEFAANVPDMPQLFNSSVQLLV